MVCWNCRGDWGDLMHSVCQFLWYKNSHHGQVQATNLTSLNLKLRRKSALKSHKEETPAHPCQHKQRCGDRVSKGLLRDKPPAGPRGLGTVLLPAPQALPGLTPSQLPEATPSSPSGSPALATGLGCPSCAAREPYPGCDQQSSSG